MLEPPLVIWVNSPPHVESGAFSYLEANWRGGVIYAVLGELRAEREAMGWGGDTESGEPHSRLRGHLTVAEFCDKTLSEFPNARHLVAGMSSVTGRALSVIVSRVPRDRIAIISERPCAFGPPAVKAARHLLQPLKYRRLVTRYRNRVGLLLPLGLAGVRDFRNYGWPEHRMSPFMYCPQLRGSATPEMDPIGGPIKFVYVGRLTRFTKGTDVLMRAVERLYGDWHLSIVGGHGDLVDAVNRWAASKDNVELLGATPPDRVWQILKQHHVAVVPSRLDGWNVVVNESLYANRGVIVSNSAVSDELIRSSGAGQVVAAGSSEELASAMQSVVDDRRIALSWARAAHAYVHRISPTTVGQHLIDLLHWLEPQHSWPMPSPPWLLATSADVDTEVGP